MVFVNILPQEKNIFELALAVVLILSIILPHIKGAG